MKLLIKHYRILHGISQSELARRTNLNQSYISKLEKTDRKHSPTIDKLELIANHLGVCTHDLIKCECKLCSSR